MKRNRRAPVLKTARWVVALTILAGSAVAAPSKNVAELLSRAAKLYESFEYDPSLEMIARAKKRAQSDEDRTQAALWEGVVAAHMGNADRASAAFEAALRIDPSARLPVEVAPRTLARFEELKATAAKTAGNGSPAPDRPEKVALSPNSAAAQPLVYAPSPGAPRRIPLWVPAGLGGLAVVSTGVATVFGLQAQHHTDAALRAPFQGEGVKSLEQARQSAFVANALFAAAGTALVGGALTYFLGGPVETPTRIGASNAGRP